MKQFKKTFWRGYQKEEVDEYIDFLTEELENLKKETNRGSGKKSRFSCRNERRNGT